MLFSLNNGENTSKIYKKKLKDIFGGE